MKAVHLLALIQRKMVENKGKPISFHLTMKTCLFSALHSLTGRGLVGLMGSFGVKRIKVTIKAKNPYF